MHAFWINNTILFASCFGALHLNILSSINLLQISRCSAPKFKPQSSVTFVENKLFSNYKVQSTETFCSWVFQQTLIKEEKKYPLPNKNLTDPQNNTYFQYVILCSYINKINLKSCSYQLQYSLSTRAGFSSEIV